MTEIAVKARFKHTLPGQKPAGGVGGRERQAFALRNLNKKYEQKASPLPFCVAEMLF